MTESLSDAGRALGSVLRGAALLREGAEAIVLDEDARLAYDDLLLQMQAVADTTRLLGGDNGANYLRLMDECAERMGEGRVSMPDEDYPDREILGVTIPGALAKEAGDLILELLQVRMALEPIVRRCEAHTAAVEALGREVMDSIRGAVTDSGATLDEVDDGVAQVLAELTENRRMSGVAFGLAEVVTGANL